MASINRIIIEKRKSCTSGEKMGKPRALVHAHQLNHMFVYGCRFKPEEIIQFI